MSPQLENEKRPDDLNIAIRLPQMTVKEAMRRIRGLGEYGESNFVSFRVGFMAIDGNYSAAELRMIAALWDACHDEEGNER